MLRTGIGAVGTAALTFAAIILPLQGGLGGGVPYRGPYLTQPIPYPNNANRKDNWNPHIVYVFIFEPKNGGTNTLKYGISDELLNGTDRPEKQLAGLTALYGPTVTWYIYRRTRDRLTALFTETLLVSQHYNSYNIMPLAQMYPLPTKLW